MPALSRCDFVAVIPERLSTGERYLVPRDLLPAALLADAPAQVIVQVTAGTSPDTVAQAIRAAGIGAAVVAIPWQLAAVMAAGGFVVTGAATLLTALGVTGTRPIRLAAARE